MYSLQRSTIRITRFSVMLKLYVIAAGFLFSFTSHFPQAIEINQFKSSINANKLSQTTNGKPTKPSVLFINIDDLNNWNSVLKGHPQTITPNLSRLANEGITFTKTIPASPVCFPSRTALFSGLHPSTSSVVSNFNWGQPWRFYLGDTVTIPKHMEDQGWKTIGAGKNFHTADKPEFQQYFKRPKEPRIIKGTGYKKGALGWAAIDGTVQDMPDYQVIDYAIDALTNNQSPLFLSVGIYRPHVPWNLPKEYFDRFPLDNFKLPTSIPNDLEDLSERLKVLAHNEAKFNKNFHHNLKGKGQDKAFARAYLASVNFADEQLGRLLDAWYRSPHSEDGYIIFWSDHGFMLGEKHGWGKFKPWWDASQANLIISGKHFDKGIENDSPVSLVDLYPTIIDLLDIKPPEHKLSGRSLMPLLEKPQTRWEEPVVMSHEEDGIRYDVVLTRQYRLTKLITGETELYDLFNDPHEWENIAKQKPDIVEELSQYVTFKIPDIKKNIELEAENLPAQTSADYGRRGNFHYRREQSDASGGTQLIAELRQKSQSYIDFVANFPEKGEFNLEVNLGKQPSNLSLEVSYFKVENDAKQTTSDFPATAAHKTPHELNLDNSFSALSDMRLSIKEPGLYTIRFKSLTDDKTKLALDRFKFTKL